MEQIQKIHTWIFGITAFYLFAESIRGYLILGDIKILRWVALFFVLIPIAYFIARPEIKNKVWTNLPLIIVIVSIVFYASYIAQGLLSEIFSEIDRWGSQGFEWAGSSYIVFPLIVAIPCAMKLIDNKKLRDNILGLVLCIFAVVISHYYESRVLFFIILAFLIISPFVMRLDRAIIFIIVLVSAWLIIIQPFWMQSAHTANEIISWYSSMIQESVVAPVTPRPFDFGRLAQLEASIITVSDNWLTSLFGFGTYQHHYVLQPVIREMYTVAAPFWADSVPSFIRTTGACAYITDYGMIGTILLIVNFMFTGTELLINRGKYFILFGVSLVMILGWFYIANILDMVILYILIMPFGLLWQLNNEDKIKQIC
jgi:hypothetical protein